MGLQHPDHGAEHEGYLIGYAPDGAPIAYPAEDLAEVARLGAACSCGWRSPRWTAPSGTRWRPCSVHLPAGAEDEALVEVLWRAHLAELDQRIAECSQVFIADQHC